MVNDEILMDSEGGYKTSASGLFVERSSRDLRSRVAAVSDDEWSPVEGD
jgi:hypothetical protein